MVLPLSATSQLLERPSPRLLMELHINGSSWPLWQTDSVLNTTGWGTGPELVSTVDTYAPFLRARTRTWEQEVRLLDPWMWWRFDDLTGFTKEYTGHQGSDALYTHGNVGAAVTRGSTGLLGGDINRCFTFVDTAGNVTLFWNDDDTIAEDESSIDPGTGDWTVLVLAQTTVSGSVRAIVRKSNTTPSLGWCFEYDRPNSRLRLTLGNLQFNSATLPVTLHDGNPHLIGATIKRDQNRLTFYIDGNPASTHDISTVPPGAIGTSAVTVISGATTGNARWAGKLDELMFFQKALGPEDMVTLARTRKWTVESLFEGRILGVPQLGFSSPSLYGGVPERIDSISFRTLNHDGKFNRAFWEEWRGKLVKAHWYEKRSGELQLNAFLGQVAGIRASDWFLDWTCTTLDRARMDDMVPRSFIRPQQFPTAPDQGAPVVYQWGTDRRVPLRYVKAKRMRVQLAGPRQAPTTAAGSAGALTGTFRYRMRFYSTATGLKSPDGPESFPITVAAQRVVVSLMPISADSMVDKKILERHVGGGQWVEAAVIPNYVDTYEDNLPGPLSLVTTPGVDPDEYEYLFPKGNSALSRVWVGDWIRQVDTDYEVLPRTHYIDGRPTTAIRFRKSQAGPKSTELAVVTADCQRVYRDCDQHTVAEWQWFQGFREFVNQLDMSPGKSLTEATTGDSDITATLALRSGPTQVDMGAVAFDGVNDYVEVNPDPFKLQTFTAEMWFLLDSACPNCTVWKGPNFVTWGFNYIPPWMLNGPYIDFHFRDWDDTVRSFDDEFPPAGQLYGWDDPLVERWHWVAATVQQPSAPGVADGTVKLYIDGYLARTMTHSGIRYEDPGLAPSAMALGTGGFGDNFFKGAIGYCRVDAVARSEKELIQGYWLMKRNPAACLREFYEKELGAVVDNDSAALATLTLDAVPVANAAYLRCDGSIDEKVPVREVVAQFAHFRGLRVEATEDGSVKFTLPEPPYESTVGFSTGPPYTNILNSSRVRASLAEAVSILPIAYRLRRDTSGKPAGWAHVLTPFITAVGRVADPMLLPLVRASKTADIIRDWYQRNLRRADEGLLLTVLHEGRALRRGHVVRVLEPRLGIEDPADYEVMAVRRTLTEYEVSLIPYDVRALTVYTPDAVPPEEASERELQQLDVGNDATLEFDDRGVELLTSDGQTVLVPQVLITPRFQNLEVALPVGVGIHNTYDALFGASTVWEATDDGDVRSNPNLHDGDDTVVVAGPNKKRITVTVRIGPHPTVFFSRVRSVSVYSLARGEEAQSEYNPRMTQVIVLNGVVYEANLDHRLYGNYRLISGSFFWNPATGQPWTLSEVQSITEIGFKLEMEGDVSPRFGWVSSLVMHYTTVLESPEGVSHWRLWKRQYIPGPGAEHLPAPTRAEDPYRMGDMLGPIQDGPDSAGSSWDYWMGLYDLFDREVAMIGPATYTVPSS